MKIIKIGFALIAMAACLVLLSRCHKSGGDPIKIEGFTLVDYSGNLISRIGAPDQDWTFVDGLSAGEMALFNFDTSSSSLDNTTMASSPGGRVGAFPNPVSSQQILAFSVSDSVLVKIVIVNSALKIFSQRAAKIGAAPSFLALDFHDRSIYPNKSVYRIYYSFSTKGHLNYKIGYGDIKICDDSNVTNCF